MNRLQEKLHSLKAQKRKALVAFITAGFPDLRTTAELIPVLEENGVDIIELGIPFSDPVADGPTIQFSSDRALQNGATLDTILSMVKKARVRTEIPLVFMSYLNPLFHGGLEKNISRVKACGADGFIIPDLIPEEGGGLKQLCRRNGLSLVFLAAPNTPNDRLAYIDAQSDSFVYIVSLTGVTGGRKALPATAKEFLLRTQKAIRHPRFVGFGISGPDQVAQLKDHADGVIVGSALIEIIRRNTNAGTRKKKIAGFIRSLRRALDA